MLIGNRLFVSLFVTALAVGSAHAQKYPAHPVTVVVPFAAGGSNDVVARLMASKLGTIMGQSFVVENRAGASGTIGANVIAKARPDGYNLLFSSGTPLAASPHLYKTLPYAVSDFSPIIRVASQSAVLVVDANSRIKDVRALTALAKEKPNSLSFGSSGVGSTEHIAATLYMMKTGTTFMHVPYKGTVPALTDLMGGRIDFVFAPLPTAMPYLQEQGKLKALAVTTRKRSSALPSVPTMIEAGVPDYEALTWLGLAGPADMPKAIVETLNAAVKTAFSSDQANSDLAKLGLDRSTDISADEFQKFIAKDSDNYAAIIKAANIPPL